MVDRILNNVSARLAVPLRWLILAGIAYSVASGILYVLAGPEATTRPTQVATPNAPSRQSIDITPLLARNLFGIRDGNAAPAPASAPAAVATQLPLELRGVFVADLGGVSAAIIAQRGRPGLLYNVGETVAGSATLEDVRTDHVVLRRAGIAETLHFPSLGQSWAPSVPMPDSAPMPEPDYSDYPDYEDYELPEYEEPVYEELYEEPGIDDPSAAVGPAAVGPTDTLASGPDDTLAVYRERLASDPASTLESLGMRPVSDGATAGYRVDSLAQAPYLGQTGLQPGDIILSVNGRPVGDLHQDRLELDNVLAHGSARIEVQRGTRRFFVTASLP
jgi:general secretion pathway protein C